MTDFARIIADNLKSVESRIAQACDRSGRQRDEVTLVAVTKYAKLEWILELIALGQRELGENRPQQLHERATQLPASVNWHLIGHLQSNKAKLVLPSVKWIHSVDSIKLLNSLDRLATEFEIRPNLLIEVNVTGEASKDGFTPDELRRSWQSACACRNVALVGLMTMAPANPDPEAARPAFRGLRLLRDEIQTLAPAGTSLPHLSMGMTGDFEIAIEEGATLVRIGSALFEGL